MSYDVDLVTEPGGWVVEVEHHKAEGGTYVLGGSNKASLDITDNYEEVFSLVNFEWGGLSHQLNGKRASETIPWLELMVAHLGTRRYQRDYWAPTPGNAGHALNILLQWAIQHPQARWSSRSPGVHVQDATEERKA